MHKMLINFFILLLPFCLLANESILEKTKGMTKQSGYFDFYWDDQSGSIYLEINKLENEFLFVTSLSQGLGSNDIGLDRGKLGREHVVYFQRIGPRILLMQPNYDYRAISDNAQEKNAVEESFAKSVLWGFEISAQSNNKYLIDFTPYLLSDAQFISRTLQNSNQGAYILDGSRSAVNLLRTKSFPQNTEFDAMLTFTSSAPGDFVRTVAPTAESITLYQHFSFIQLPDLKYKKREYDPRAGIYAISFFDYATPINQPLEKKYIVRHRLEKQNPALAKSPAKEPIIYYVDNGAPEPIRSALIEGASWWTQAFEAIGFENAFQVKVLPQDADPMDVRYNVIQWVHRSTRGWSYGGSVVDPRTGEILKGHVSLGSLRVRQDFLIAEGLLAPYKTGDEIPNDMEKMALARLRQLSAHEVGHTLGLMHNFAASTNNRASVMDYPHPLIKINEDDQLDLSKAYAAGIGDWDKIAIAYAYSEFSKEQESASLANVINEYIKKGLHYITDSDARPQGGAHPDAHLWDNGQNAVDDLKHILKVRQVALNNFSESVIRIGEPYANIENALVPIYLMHRYAVEAVSKLIAGLEYMYALRGDEQVITEFIDSDLQNDAINILLETLQPTRLELNEDLIALLPPHPPGFERNREHFNSKTGITFDPLSAVESAAIISISQLFHPQRLVRMIQFNQRETDNPSLSNLFETTFEKLFANANSNGMSGEIQRLVQVSLIDFLLNILADTSTANYLAAHLEYHLKKWGNELKDQQVRDSKWALHNSYLINKIQTYFNNPALYERAQPVKVPPGSPIGSDLFWNFDCSF